MFCNIKIKCVLIQRHAGCDEWNLFQSSSSEKLKHDHDIPKFHMGLY
jgi:hypothetical protein